MRMPVTVMAGQFCLFLLEFHLEADRGEEWLEMVEEVLLRYSGVKVQEVEELPLHQVHLCQTEPEAIESLHRSVSCPMLVLWARVVQILRSEDQ